MATQRAHIFDRITADVIESMTRDGLAPWQRPWACMGQRGLPRNVASGKEYRGINVLVLLGAAWARGYSDPRWLTYKQATDLGGHVRKGEKGTKIVFWKILRKDDGDGGERKVPLAREYTVFNVAQCEGLELAPIASVPAAPSDRVEAAESLLAAPICAIRHGGDKAYYSPMHDYVQLPERGQFRTLADYYTVAFHELGHATGHTSRLDRTFGASFADHKYSREELVAELCACMVAASTGVQRSTLENSAAYLKIWAAKLKDEPRLLIDAAQAAQKAADYVLDHALVSDEDDAEDEDTTTAAMAA